MKLFKALILCLSVTFLSGCIPHTELDEQAIVESIGIDYENDKYTVTVHYFNMEGAGGNAPIDPTKANVIKIDGKGDSVSTALESASIKCGRSFMYGITSLIILGRDALGEDVLKTLSFAESYYQSNPSVLIAAADKKASDILDVKFKEGITSVERLEMVLKNAEYYGLGENVRILEFLSEQRRISAATVLPLLAVVNTGSDASDDGKSIELKGGALIKERKYTGELSLSDMSGLQILGAKPMNTVISVEAENEKVSITVYDIDCKIKHTIEDDGLKFRIDIRANGKFTDSQLSKRDNASGEAIEKICGEILKKRIADALNNSVIKYGCDPCDLKYVISSSDYIEWAGIEREFEKLLTEAEFDINYDIDIDRFGIAH